MEGLAGVTVMETSVGAAGRPPVTVREVKPETVPDVAVIVAVPAGPELGEVARPVALI